MRLTAPDVMSAVSSRASHTNDAALAQLLRTLSYAEQQARKTGSAADCRTAARYCREVATQAAYADKGGYFDRSGEWDARAEAAAAR